MNEELMNNGHRVVAWMDGLTDEEQVHVKRLATLPQEMQIGMVWVDFSRRMDALEEEHRQAMRTGALVKNVASGVGGGCMVILALIGHALGWDQVVTK